MMDLLLIKLPAATLGHSSSRPWAPAGSVGGGLTRAEGGVNTPYGTVSASWKLEGEQFTVCIQVPVGTVCRLILPDGTEKSYGSGCYTASCVYDPS